MRQTILKHIILALVLALPSQYAFALFKVDVYDNLGNFGHIDDAIASMNAATVTNSALFDVVNFSEGGGPFGNYGGDSAFPGNPGDYFGVHVTGSILVPTGQNYYGINHDDGALLQFIGLDVIKWPTPTAPKNTFGSITNLVLGEVSVDLWLYENAGIASLEFFHSDANSVIGDLVASAPEPGILALMGLGLAGMGFARKSKKA